MMGGWACAKTAKPEALEHDSAWVWEMLGPARPQVFHWGKKC